MDANKKRIGIRIRTRIFSRRGTEDAEKRQEEFTWIYRMYRI